MKLSAIGYRLSAIVIVLGLLSACTQPTASAPTQAPSPTSLPASPAPQSSPVPSSTNTSTPSPRPNDGPPTLIPVTVPTTIQLPLTDELVLGRPMHLKIGVTAKSSDGLSLELHSLKDSRCPPTLACVWSGEVVVDMTLKEQDRVLGTPSLHLYPNNLAPKEADWSGNGYSVSLLALDPVTRPVPDLAQEEYSFLVLVRQAELPKATQSAYISVGPQSPDGVIVPRDLAMHYSFAIQGNQEEQGFWQPLPDDIARFEAALPEFLRTAAAERSPDLWKKVGSYKRQYAGILENDQLLIHMNAFCEYDQTSGHDWRSEPVIVMDGGDCFFQVVYNIQTGTFERLMINGDA